MAIAGQQHVGARREDDDLAGVGLAVVQHDESGERAVRGEHVAEADEKGPHLHVGDVASALAIASSTTSGLAGSTPVRDSME
jgi:hypothetical protein